MRRRSFRNLSFSAALASCAVLQAPAQDFSAVPGKVLAYVESPTALELLLGQEVYITDPSIAVLPNGDYVASHALFGDGSTAETSGMTSLFRSSDGGVTWASLGTLPDILRASLFWHDGALYLFGAKSFGATARIRKSLDNGTTWTTPANSSNGLLSIGGPGTPNHPAVHAGRLWTACGTRMASAPATADLLQAGSWTLSTGIAENAAWFGGLWQGWSEGQAVASAATGVAVMPKIRALPNSALLRCNTATGTTISFDPEHDFVDIPGCEKKFGAAYDAVSGKFFVLSNPVLPIHANHPTLASTPELIRNAAAVVTSTDQYHWEVEKIFLYTAHIEYEAFQYLNFDFDGDDMAVAARTAFDVGETLPPRGHDSNLLTFHKIENFRNLSRNHFLVFDTANDRVQRFEPTQHTDAPLGAFPLGDQFAGAPLDAPDGLAQAPDGTVCIREQGGRILRFDAAGNFLGLAASSPVPFESGPLAITQPPAGERTWTQSGSGSWRDLTNWYYWGRPDTSPELAVFGSAATGPATVTVTAGTRGWNFDNANDFEGWTTTNITGASVAGGLLLGTTQSDPQIIRTNLAISGSRYPEARVRMRASVPSASVDFYWGTTLANSFNETRKIRLSYTGAGQFQELVFPLAGLAGWDGQVITRLRVDPFNSPEQVGESFEIDSILIHRPSYRLRGLRFRSAQPYTLSGDGSLEIAPDTGSGQVDVQEGSHTIAVPLVLAADATVALAAGASLDFQAAPEIAGHALAISGPGTASSAAVFAIGAGHLAVSGGAEFAHAPPLVIAAGGRLTLDGGTVRLAPEVTVAAGAALTGSGRIDGHLNAMGTLVPGLSPGALSAGSAALAGALEIDIDGASNGRLEIDGALDVDAGHLTITTLAGGATAPVYVLANYGTLAGTGTFASVTGIPQTYGIDYTYDTGDSGFAIALVSPYFTWTAASSLPAPGDEALDADPNGDGVKNGVAFLAGAAHAMADARDLLPFTTRDSTGVTFTFRRASAARNLSARVEYGTGLSSWSPAVHGQDGVLVTETKDGFGPGIDRVEVRLPDALAIGGRLFARLAVW